MFAPGVPSDFGRFVEIKFFNDHEQQSFRDVPRFDVDDDANQLNAVIRNDAVVIFVREERFRGYFLYHLSCMNGRDLDGLRIQYLG